tara:strand:+ start:695 stop:850 length:156 start_codon:yes stop_codon:yes gene_type:complete
MSLPTEDSDGMVGLKGGIFQPDLFFDDRNFLLEDALEVVALELKKKTHFPA